MSRIWFGQLIKSPKKLRGCWFIWRPWMNSLAKTHLLGATNDYIRSERRLLRLYSRDALITLNLFPPSTNIPHTEYTWAWCMYIFPSIPSNNLLQSLFDGLESLQFLPQLEPEQQPQHLKKIREVTLFFRNKIKFFKSRETPKKCSKSIVIVSFNYWLFSHRNGARSRCWLNETIMVVIIDFILWLPVPERHGKQSYH